MLSFREGGNVCRAVTLTLLAKKRLGRRATIYNERLFDNPVRSKSYKLKRLGVLISSIRLSLTLLLLKLGFG